MFECDRIVRNSVDALHPLQTSQPSDKPEASSSDAAQDDAAAGLSLERFYLIYGASRRPSSARGWRPCFRDLPSPRVRACERS